jgi:uncharacterized protein (TIGR02145 family)
LLLPRVKLVSNNSLAPLLTSAEEASDSLKYLLAGLTVYNITASGPSLYPAVYTWDGSQWKTSEANEVNFLAVARQPEPFTFCESGGGDITLTFNVNGGVNPKFQWFQITSTNVHVRVGDTIKTDGIGSGYDTQSLTLGSSILQGTTKNARYCGFYKFYCIVTDDLGQLVESNTAEVAVGCGAKKNDGSWLSFMCFNLGADNNSTIASQTGYSITFQNDSIGGLHTYTANEEKLYGSLFQWGRIADGHELRSDDGDGNSFKTSQAYNSPSDITVAALDSGNLCTTSDTRRPLSQIRKSSSWYGKFIHGLSNWNPISSSNQTALDQLWRTTRFVQNDPCAHYKADGTYQEFWNETAKTSPNNSSAACTDAGTNWRTPTQEEWGSIYKGGTVSGTYGSATANTWFQYYTTNYPGNGNLNITRSLGYEIRPDGKTATLFLPASGFRNSSNGSLYYQGTNGYYWSSSIAGISAYNLSFSSSSVSPANSSNRARGFALRCIKNL